MEKIESFSGEYYFLSNFYPCEITFIDGYTFTSVEHAYQASKTTIEEEIQKFVKEAGITASQAKRLGRKVTLRPDWEDIKLRVMVALISRKFESPELRAKLLATGTAEIVEGNYWNDYFWGVCNGKGDNYLGKILMTERAKG